MWMWTQTIIELSIVLAEHPSSITVKINTKMNQSSSVYLNSQNWITFHKQMCSAFFRQKLKNMKVQFQGYSIQKTIDLELLELSSILVVWSDLNRNFFILAEIARISRIFHLRNVWWVYLEKQIQMVLSITISDQSATNRTNLVS